MWEDERTGRIENGRAYLKCCKTRVIFPLDFYCLALGSQHFRRLRLPFGRNLHKIFAVTSMTRGFYLPAILNIKFFQMMLFESRTRGDTDVCSRWEISYKNWTLTLYYFSATDIMITQKSRSTAVMYFELTSREEIF